MTEKISPKIQIGFYILSGTLITLNIIKIIRDEINLRNTKKELAALNAELKAIKDKKS